MQVRRRRGGGEDEDLEVVELEPHRRFAARDNIGPFLLVATCLIEPAGERASIFTLTANTKVSGP